MIHIERYGYWNRYILHLSVFLSLSLPQNGLVSCFSMTSENGGSKLSNPDTIQKMSPNEESPSYTFSIPLNNARPKPESFLESMVELWNDPRPINSVIGSKKRSYVGTREDSSTGSVLDLPYCIVSDEFDVGDSARFQVLLYPRGRFVGASNPEMTESGMITGLAGTYLKYIPKEYGDEVDISWRVRLVDSRTNESLPTLTSGGLPRSKDTWSAAMTFCADNEAVESIGRVADWGTSSWLAKDVCDALGHLKAEIEVTVFDTRRGESMFAWPPGSKGGFGAVRKARVQLPNDTSERNLKVGEVIVPVLKHADEGTKKNLEKSFIYSGIDYRIMTMSDKDGNEIFSTNSLPTEEREFARCALRPCGFRLQNELWKKRGMKTEWPVEIDVKLIAPSVLTRFSPGAAIPRLVSAFSRDKLAYLLAIALAIAPIPLVLLGRNVVSLYVIPSASMEPTLMKGDVLLVEKLPRVLERSKRGDVILFKPPNSLKQIIGNNGGSAVSGTSLFVKRIVGLPGDTDVIMDEDTNEVTIGGSRAIGPDRNMCEDEPLRLIDRLLENGNGKALKVLGENEVYVLGDCKAVSVDSRVFGVLPKDDIIGKPLARTWPLQRMTIKPL